MKNVTKISYRSFIIKLRILGGLPTVFMDNNYQMYSVKLNWHRFWRLLPYIRTVY